MSYSAVPANYRSDDDDQLESPTFQPPKLQLRNFDFGSSLSLGVNGSRSRSGSRVKSSIHSGTSYEMVDSDTESNYDEGGSDGEVKQKGKGREDTGNGENKRNQDQEEEIAGSGVLVSKASLSSRNNAESMQGGGSNSHGQQQQQAQHQVHDHSTARSGVGLMHPQITEDPSRPGLQLGGRADNERGVSAHTSAVSPRHEYRVDNNNGDHPRSQKGRGGSRPQPILPSLPPPPALGQQGQFEYSASPDDIHPVFRHSQSVPELPPVDVQGLHIQEDRDYRPATSASGVGDLFKDFDGVHFDLDNPEAPGLPLRNQQGYPPPLQAAHHQYRQSQAYPDQSQVYPDNRYSQAYYDRPNTESQTSPSLIFYPAPVPAMLNLPPTLSKARLSNRKSRVLASESVEQLASSNRRSVVYPGPTPLGGGPSEKDIHRRSVATMNGNLANNRRSIANLPPALRASQFFDSQLPSVVPNLKEESAVATLDSILDASARAPAAAFTDHPITGGSAPYAHTRNRSVAINVKLHPGESPRSSMEGTENPDHHNHNPDYNDDDAGDHLNPETGEYYDPQRFSGTSEELAANAFLDPSLQPPPTTLLAELESRKAQQRLRTRTAASAFPRGIRSTLLQLDAVAEVQQQHRRTKKTHLAWEEEDPQDEDERDEDVPLGVLFSVAPGVQKRRDDEIPLGLLMKKEMEDAEPLSKRRERLRTASGQQPMSQQHSRSMLDVAGLGELGANAEDEEVEGETLKERMKRLKEKQQFGTGALDMDFASSDSKEKDQQKQADKPEVEETLAERRRRLQKEREEEEKHQVLRRESVMLQQEVKSRRNMANLLHAKPMGMAGARPQSFYSMHGGTGGSYGQLPMYQQPGFSQSGMLGMNMGMGGYGMGGPGLIGRGAGAMGPAGMGMMGPGEVVLDPKQREVVERWRASVM